MENRIWIFPKQPLPWWEQNLFCCPFVPLQCWDFWMKNSFNTASVIVKARVIVRLWPGGRVTPPSPRRLEKVWLTEDIIDCDRCVLLSILNLLSMVIWASQNTCILGTANASLSVRRLWHLWAVNTGVSRTHLKHAFSLLKHIMMRFLFFSFVLFCNIV